MIEDDLIPYPRLRESVWERLCQAVDLPTHPCRLVTFTSVRSDGRPDARLLVLRGANADAGLLWFHTDSRAGKVEQLEQEPWTCVVVYDRRDGVQMRLRGKIEVHFDDLAARQHWEQINLAMRHSYSVSATPGSTVACEDPLVRRRRTQAGGDEESLGAGFDNFAVLEMLVDEIDWLQVTDHAERRALLCRSGQWVAEALAP